MPRNNKGGGGGRPGGRQRPRGALTRRATSNVQLQDASQANLLQQQLQQAQTDWLRQTQAADAIWPGAQEAIRDLPRPGFDQIQTDYDRALGTVRDLFGGGEAAPYMAAGEGAAGMGLGNAYGEAGATMLANAAAREGMYRSSAAREANLSQQYAKDNLLQQLQDTLQGYNDQMSQLRADDPWQIAQETQTLWDRAQQQKALKAKLASDAAFSEWLQGRASDLGNQNPRRGQPGPGPGGGGPSPYRNAPTVSGGVYGGQSHAAIDNQGAPVTDVAAPGQYSTDPRGSGLGPTAGSWSGGPGARRVVRDVRQADTMADLPGWVRYAYRRTGGTSLHDMDRRRLYEDKLGDILRRNLGAGGDLYR